MYVVFISYENISMDFTLLRNNLGHGVVRFAFLGLNLANYQIIADRRSTAGLRGNRERSRRVFESQLTCRRCQYTRKNSSIIRHMHWHIRWLQLCFSNCSRTWCCQRRRYRNWYFWQKQNKDRWQDDCRVCLCHYQVLRLWPFLLSFSSDGSSTWTLRVLEMWKAFLQPRSVT